MKVSFQDFSPNTPDKDCYERGVDYLWHDFDLNLEDTFYLIEKLKTNRSSVIVYFPLASVDFHLFDNMLCVQIDADGFWFGENINLEMAKEILKVAFEGCSYFGSRIPNTNREWEAYSL